MKENCEFEAEWVGRTMKREKEKGIESVNVCMFVCGGKYRRFDAIVERWIRCIDKIQYIKNSCGNSIGYLLREGTKLDSGESSPRGQREKIY